jgi:hypothetical protein
VLDEHSFDSASLSSMRLNEAPGGRHHGHRSDSIRNLLRSEYSERYFAKHLHCFGRALIDMKGHNLGGHGPKHSK